VEGFQRESAIDRGFRKIRGGDIWCATPRGGNSKEEEKALKGGISVETGIAGGYIVKELKRGASVEQCAELCAWNGEVVRMP